MGEVELGYRQGRSLANIIPPDRRRAKAAALVFMGMLSGATVFGLADHVTARAEPPRVTIVSVPAPSVQSFHESRREPPPREFDDAAATLLLENIDVEDCAKKRGATNEAKVDVTFSNAGAIVDVRIESGPHPTSEAGRCLVTTLGAHPLRIPPFDGAPAHVKTTYELESE